MRTYELLTTDQAEEMLKYFEVRPNYFDWIRIIAALKNYFGIQTAHSILLTRFKDEKPDEHLKQLHQNLNRIHIGTFIKMAKDRGYQFKKQSKKHCQYEQGGFLEYWEDYMDKTALETLIANNEIIPIQNINITKGNKSYTLHSKKKNPIFCFRYNELSIKIYQPLNYNRQYRFQWCNYKKENTPIIWGLNKLNSDYNYILIVEGVKDYLVAKANKINAIGLDSVITKISDDIILELCNKYKKVILCLDNDKPGEKRTRQLTEKYPLSKIDIPKAINNENLKDISDLIKYSRKHDRKVIDEFIHQIELLPENTDKLKEGINKLNNDLIFKTEGLNNNIYNNLPEDLKNLVSVFKSNHEKDMFLLSTIVVISGILPNYQGFYHRKYYYANLYLYVVAPAATGKGVLEFSRNLAKPIEELIKKESKDYVPEQEDNTQRRLDPILFIPANSSSTGFLELLNNNGGFGILFENEGDTLANIHKTEYGNYSDSFRKAFHHEVISYYRRANKELVTIKQPKLSCILSGTPSQVKNLIPNAENGLLSRFIFYFTNVKPKMEDVFDEQTFISNQDFNVFSNKLLSIWEILNKKKNEKKNLKFVLTNKQKQEFIKKLEKYFDESDNETISIMPRMGLIAFRIMMIFSILRQNNDNLDVSDEIICNDKDFYNVFEIINILVKHSLAIFDMLPTQQLIIIDEKKAEFYKSLPDTFSRQEAQKHSMKYHLSRSTVDRFIKQHDFFEKIGHGLYKKRV